MRLTFSNALLLLSLLKPLAAFLNTHNKISRRDKSYLLVSIGLGPEETGEEKETVARVDYEIPDHEAYRTSRRSKLDEKCDKWFSDLLGGEDDKGILGSLADDARRILVTPVPLVNEVSCFTVGRKTLLGMKGPHDTPNISFSSGRIATR